MGQIDQHRMRKQIADCYFHAQRLPHSRDHPPAPASALPPRSPPVQSQSPLPEPHSRGWYRHRLPAPAAPCGPASHWESAVSSPAVHTPPEPCTRAASPINKIEAPLRQPPLARPQRYSTPPDACPLACLLAPAPPPRAHPHAPPAAPRSLPTRSGILESLLENHSALKTRCSRPAAISPGLLSGTSALPPR